ncbi:MAG: hypothetical protein ACNA8H_03355 [Anaerolineales bacterium]
MVEKNNRTVTPYRGGVFFDLMNRVRLILRLIRDRRVSFLIKLLPIGSFIYLIVYPDLAPGPVDDAAIIWLGMYAFVELCPPEVVQEHMAALDRQVGKQKGSRATASSEVDDVIDAEFREVE